VTDIVVQHITVPRTARYYVVGTPSPNTRDVWIACHGYGQLAAPFAEPFRAVASDTRIVLVPEGLSRFYTVASQGQHGPEATVGASWMTREDRDVEINDIITYLDHLAEHTLAMLASHGVERENVRVGALGFSQGTATVSRWVARGATLVDRLIVWGGGIPHDVNVRALTERTPQLRVDAVYGVRDQFITPAHVEALRTMLEASGVPYTIRSFDGGHALSRHTLREIMER